MNNRYEIRTLADFIAVPSDKREHCLRDFAAWCECIELAKTLGEIVGGGVIPDTSVFAWIDDGKSDAHVTITVQP